MTHDNAEDVEARVLWQAGMNAVAAHGSPSSWPLKKRVRRKVADAHKYGMLRFVVPLLHVHLLRREAIDLAYIGASLTGMHARSDGSEEDIRRSLTYVFSSGFGGATGRHAFEGEGYHADRPTHDFIAWFRTIRRRLMVLKGALGFLPIVGPLICGAIDLRIAQRMASSSEEP